MNSDLAITRRAELFGAGLMVCFSVVGLAMLVSLSISVMQGVAALNRADVAALERRP